MLEEVSNTHESISMCKKDIKTLEKRAENQEQQNYKYKFFKKCFEEGKHDIIIKEVNAEYPTFYEKMWSPVKVLHC